MQDMCPARKSGQIIQYVNTIFKIKLRDKIHMVSNVFSRNVLSHNVNPGMTHSCLGNMILSLVEWNASDWIIFVIS